jgi:hypothetical protein
MRPFYFSRALSWSENSFSGCGDQKNTSQPASGFNDLVADMHAMEKVLISRGYPHLTIQSEVIEGEDHLTVAPDIITHGLLWAPGTK